MWEKKKCLSDHQSITAALYIQEISPIMLLVRLLYDWTWYGSVEYHS